MQYACRKTLADSRPRVRGRFAKNDDFGEAPRPVCSNLEEDDDDEVRFMKRKIIEISSNTYLMPKTLIIFKIQELLFPLQLENCFI